MASREIIIDWPPFQSTLSLLLALLRFQLHVVNLVEVGQLLGDVVGLLLLSLLVLLKVTH